MSVVAFVGTSQLTQNDAVNDQVLDAEDRTHQPGKLNVHLR
jgi:hypothetical protein